MKPNIAHFSLPEAHNDSNGKSSNIKMNDTVIIWTSCITLLLSAIGVLMKVPDAVSLSGAATLALGFGAGLSGYSKKKGVEQIKIQ